jgi:hypothetical protein
MASRTPAMAGPAPRIEARPRGRRDGRRHGARQERQHLHVAGVALDHEMRDQLAAVAHGARRRGTTRLDDHVRPGARPVVRRRDTPAVRARLALPREHAVRGRADDHRGRHAGPLRDPSARERERRLLVLRLTEPLEQVRERPQNLPVSVRHAPPHDAGRAEAAGPPCHLRTAGRILAGQRCEPPDEQRFEP